MIKCDLNIKFTHRQITKIYELTDVLRIEVATTLD